MGCGGVRHGSGGTEPLEGEALVVEEVLPGEGWEHEVTTESAEEVEITFTGEDGTTTLHATLGEDGLAAVEVCAG